MIRATDLVKVFEKNEAISPRSKKTRKVEFAAVDHISLEANAGEIVGILGPNGAGKTTLLRMLGKLMQPTEGGVIMTDEQGEPVTDAIAMKERIGYLSGNTKLYHRLSTRELLYVLGDIYQLSKEECTARIEEIIEVLQLQGFIDNRIEKLSTGQTQRASIARCLIHRPQLYIFDEPTLGLDIISSDAIIQFMKQEKENGKSILYSTHYMEEAQYLCDRIIMLHKGRIIAGGTPEELMRETGTGNLRETFQELIKGEDDE